MLNRLWRWSYWPLAIIVALCAVALIWTFSPDQYPQGGKDKHPSAQATQETPQDVAAELVARYTKVLAGLTAILSVVSVGQVYFLIQADRRAAETSEQSGRQFSIMARQADLIERQGSIAREQLFAEHRPRLVIKDVFLVREGSCREVIYEISNAGGSKATLIEGFIAVRFVNDPRDFKKWDLGEKVNPTGHDAEFDAGELKEFNTTVSEGIGVTLSFVTDPRTIHGKSLRETLFCFGILKYVDARGEEFGPVRRCVFRRAWDGTSFVRTDNPDHEYSD